MKLSDGLDLGSLTILVCDECVEIHEKKLFNQKNNEMKTLEHHFTFKSKSWNDSMKWEQIFHLKKIVQNLS